MCVYVYNCYYVYYIHMYKDRDTEGEREMERQNPFHSGVVKDHLICNDVRISHNFGSWSIHGFFYMHSTP